MSDTLWYSMGCMILGIMVVICLAWLEDRRSKNKRKRESP